jgi:hypothetical protein
MKIFLFFVYSILFLFLEIDSTQSQVLPPVSMEVYVSLAPNDTSQVWADTSFNETTQVTALMFVLLQDTIHISKVHVRMGSSPGGFELFQKTFIYSIVGNFSDGTSLNRNGSQLSLGLGNYNGLNLFYAQIQLEDNQGNLSTFLNYDNH